MTNLYTIITVAITNICGIIIYISVSIIKYVSFRSAEPVICKSEGERRSHFYLNCSILTAVKDRKYGRKLSRVVLETR